MKKIFYLSLTCLLSILLIGCMNSNNITVTFKHQNEEISTEIEKNKAIDETLLLSLNITNIEGIYYDSEYNNKYNNESLKEDVTLYIKLKDSNQNTDSPIYENHFESHQDFLEFIKNFNTLKKTYISFDFTNSNEIVPTNYKFGAVISLDKLDEINLETIYDYQVDMFYVMFEFEAYDYVLEDNYISFSIECIYEHFEVYDSIDSENIEFILQSVQDNIYKYNMVCSGSKLMQINITLSNNEESSLVNDILEMFKENIILIK